MATPNTDYPRRPRSKSPSFSSILLDSIYRSFDVDPYVSSDKLTAKAGEKQRRNRVRSESTVTSSSSLMFESEIVDLRKAIMIEHWMEKQERNREVRALDEENIRFVRQKSAPNRKNSGGYNLAGNGGGEAEYYFSSCFTPSKNRTRFDHAPAKRDGRLLKNTKSRAMKIYGDLKKVKQPISPGRRIASFLNSIFTAKKQNETVSDRKLKTPSTNASSSTSTSCSSASSFSRSCLSKTPASSKGNSSSAGKRSVRFYPVTVIVDEDSRPCGHKSIHQHETPNLIHSKSFNRSNFSKKPSRSAISIANSPIEHHQKQKIERNTIRDEESHCDCEFGDEIDDVESCASSDLFELENLSSIGLGVSRYSEELPVYGTTSLQQNHAIVNRLLV